MKHVIASAALALLTTAAFGVLAAAGAQIYALPSAAACLVTPGTTTAGYVISWGSTNGCSLASGYPVANSGANTVLETDSSGHIGASTLPSDVVSGPGSSTSGYVASWTGTGGKQLATGYPVGNSGANTVLETDSGGHIGAGVIPDPLTGHLEFSGTTPAPQSNCGSGAAVSGNDVVGRITLGSAPGGYCQIDFAAGWTNTPVCAVANETSGARGVYPQPTTSALSIVADSGSLTASDSLVYSCTGYR